MYFTVNDGTRLHALEQGEGFPLLLLAGGGFSSAIFKHQIDSFSQHYRVIALDMRSHGQSERVTHGMRIARLAKDLKEVTESLSLDSFHVIAHSLGCSVIYSFIDLFSEKSIEKAILIDQPPVLTRNPIWSKSECLTFGATYDSLKNYGFLNRMSGGQFHQVKEEMIAAMTTKTLSKELRTFITSCLDIAPEAASLLYKDNLATDWRDLIPTISIPSLVIGGRASLTPWQSQEWISQNIAGSQLKIFDESEGGSHFMFVENPSTFNEVVKKFLLES